MTVPENTLKRLAEIRENDRLARHLRGDDLDDDHATDAEVDRRDLLVALDDVLRIVSAWCAEANNIGGIGDYLVRRLQQAGYTFPTEDDDV